MSAQADPSLRWVHMSFCWFCCAATQMRTRGRADSSENTLTLHQQHMGKQSETSSLLLSLLQFSTEPSPLSLSLSLSLTITFNLAQNKSQSIKISFNAHSAWSNKKLLNLFNSIFLFSLTEFIISLYKASMCQLD